MNRFVPLVLVLGLFLFLVSASDRLDYVSLYEYDGRVMTDRGVVQVWVDTTGYKNCSKVCPVSHYRDEIVLGTKVVYEQGSVKGVRVDGGEEFIGDFRVSEGSLVEWSVPIGDRSEEFNDCFDYEVEKGVCRRRKV